MIDDSKAIPRSAETLLKKVGCDLVTAVDGYEALAKITVYKPDIIFVDIMMPRMDGFELATHMQNEPVYSDIPIIMITSRTGEKHRNRALGIGVANYMDKPYQEDELISNIQKALDCRT